MENLWGFSKTNLKKDLKDTPHGILKQQIDYFEENTNNVLFGKIKNITIQYSECEYPLSTSFEIVAPSLDSYSYKVFTMYCKPESDYPVLIFTHKAEYFDDITEYSADFYCKDKQEFLDALKTILSSEDTTRIVQTLYSKCNL